MPFPVVAGPFDDLLVPFNPHRSLETIWGTLELYTAADPKIAAARGLVQERLGSLPIEDLETVTAVLWATYRRQLCAGARPSRLRDWLTDGDRVLWSVQVALDSFMRPSALAELAEAARQLEISDDADTSELAVARAELANVSSEDIGPPKVLGFVIAFGHSYVEHYIETHPPEPQWPDDER